MNPLLPLAAAVATVAAFSLVVRLALLILGRAFPACPGCGLDPAWCVCAARRAAARPTAAR